MGHLSTLLAVHEGIKRTDVLQNLNDHGSLAQKKDLECISLLVKWLEFET